MKNRRINKTMVKRITLVLLPLAFGACVSHADDPDEIALSGTVKTALNGKETQGDKESSGDTKNMSNEESLRLSPDGVAKQRSLAQGSGIKNNKVTNMTKGQQIEHCKQDLAKQLNADLEKVSVLTTRPVTWRSGALGCPETDVSYTQALVPGRMIVLAVNDKVYRYHAAVKGTPFLCPNNRAETSLIQPGDL